MTKKRLKLKKKNLLLFIGFIVLTILFIYSIVNIIIWSIDSKKTDDIIKSVNDISEVVEVEDTSDTVIEQVEEIPKANPYWDYIKMNLINVNFQELKKINNNTKGWIQVSGTNINYPFVQTNDNKYYLNHSFNNSYNNAGWVFLDYRNSIDSLSKNTIIYAHGRTDTTMFGSLKNILKSDWLKNEDNYVVKIATPHEISLWQVFSIYRIPTTSDYIKTEFKSDDDFIDFTKMLIARSAYSFNTSVLEDDKILTLSTCYNDFEKVVMHAKLIKKSRK